MRHAITAVILAVVGICIAHFALVRPMPGFLLYVLGMLAALIGVIASVVALVRSRSAGSSPPARAGRSLLVSAAVLLLLLVPLFSAGNAPRINDITTDGQDPPAFAAAGDLGPNQGRDMSYPGASFAEQQAAAYPDLVSKHVALTPADTMKRLRAAILELPRTKIIAYDPAAGRIEATQTSWLFRFVDDVVARVRRDGQGSLVDLRSKSRDGQGDFGANAARIKALLAALDS